MVRCTILVNKVGEIKDVIEAIKDEKDIANFDIVRIKNNLDNYIQNVNINVIFLSRIIGEIQIKYKYCS